jgi:hypothetical protein
MGAYRRVMTATLAAATMLLAVVPLVPAGPEAQGRPAGERGAQIAQYARQDAVAFTPTKSRSDGDVRDRLQDSPVAASAVAAETAPIFPRSGARRTLRIPAGTSQRVQLCCWLI